MSGFRAAWEGSHASHGFEEWLRRLWCLVLPYACDGQKTSRGPRHFARAVDIQHSPEFRFSVERRRSMYAHRVSKVTRLTVATMKLQHLGRKTVVLSHNRTTFSGCPVVVFAADAPAQQL